jgi:hypothetical protein
VLAKADFSLPEAIRLLAHYEVQAAFFVPTQTALNKNIMDAHHSFRAFLEREGLHDFRKQPQGSDHKVTLPVTIATSKTSFETKMSLYRPETKGGDPRFWLSGLGKVSSPNNLWAMWLDLKIGLVAINVSEAFSQISALEHDSPIRQLLELARDNRDISTSEELLEKLTAIHNRGFIDSLKSGDTGVGFTLESLLGIKANSSKSPDYRGIELKAKRPSTNNRVNLFSLVPDWKNSAIRSAKELVKEHGYFDPKRERNALYVTLNASPNAQGLYLEVDEDSGALRAKKTISNERQEVVLWSLTLLRQNLENKHAETFWVTAATRKAPTGVEQFHYKSVIHTRKPLVEYFETLIESSVITLDFTLHLRPDGTTRDHGYLFKIRPDSLDLLFPAPMTYDLSKFLH